MHQKKQKDPTRADPSETNLLKKAGWKSLKPIETDENEKTELINSRFKQSTSRIRDLEYHQLRQEEARNSQSSGQKQPENRRGLARAQTRGPPASSNSRSSAKQQEGSEIHL